MLIIEFEQSSGKRTRYFRLKYFELSETDRKDFNRFFRSQLVRSPNDRMYYVDMCGQSLEAPIECETMTEFFQHIEYEGGHWLKRKHPA